MQILSSANHVDRLHLLVTAVLTTDLLEHVHARVQEELQDAELVAGSRAKMSIGAHGSLLLLLLVGALLQLFDVLEQTERHKLLQYVHDALTDARRADVLAYRDVVHGLQDHQQTDLTGFGDVVERAQRFGLARPVIADVRIG